MVLKHKWLMITHGNGTLCDLRMFPNHLYVDDYAYEWNLFEIFICDGALPRIKLLVLLDDLQIRYLFLTIGIQEHTNFSLLLEKSGILLLQFM